MIERVQVHSINEELGLNKNSVIDSSDNISVGEDKEDYDDKKPMIAKESSLMATIIGKIQEKKKMIQA